ncbi:hypothetical protein Mp_4g11970 [Marchantia polymorpha subsp. ruderalis]|uniref:Uncharacterized protein n=2 Tax=Marchantia polymorpha TaxID=3197 RepID=A0AAF6B902_MARPO|nr:hypothetical protein MARPO_0011s0182 [Marchantia polymorpha]BBN08486.1 hypothetical protein Mp_4g11970 [Marchantia polymorpha subsp. ruderalis]|eukprot:PTQ46523.1 hypothetical protein MARPO_0011s0182 [Marchantia polymorpha]
MGRRGDGKAEGPREQSALQLSLSLLANFSPFFRRRRNNARLRSNQSRTATFSELLQALELRPLHFTRDAFPDAFILAAQWRLLSNLHTNCVT